MFSSDHPAHFNDLDAALKEAWRQIERGVANRNSPLHTLVVATPGPGGGPDARVMVLRAADPIARSFDFFTDSRSAKVAAIGDGAAATIVGYDSRRRLHLRFHGRATIHLDDASADAAWQACRLTSRRAYLAPLPPGTVQAEPTSGLPEALECRVPTRDESEAGRANFALLRITADRLDWLYLANAGHRRALFDWSSGTARQTWLTP